MASEDVWYSDDKYMIAYQSNGKGAKFKSVYANDSLYSKELVSVQLMHMSHDFHAANHRRVEGGNGGLRED